MRLGERMSHKISRSRRKLVHRLLTTIAACKQDDLRYEWEAGFKGKDRLILNVWIEGEGRFDLKKLLAFFDGNDGCLFTTDVAPRPDSFVRVMGYVSDPLVVVQITIFIERVESEQTRAIRISPSRN